MKKRTIEKKNKNQLFSALCNHVSEQFLDADKHKKKSNNNNDFP